MIYARIKNYIINFTGDGFGRFNVNNKFNFGVSRLMTNFRIGDSRTESLIFRDKNMPLYGNKIKKECIIMMNFVLLTVSFTVAILLASVIATVIMFKLMGNAKVMKKLTKYYMGTIEKVVEDLEDDFNKGIGA